MGLLNLKKTDDPTFRRVDDIPQIPVVLSEWTIIIPTMYTVCYTMLQTGLL
jgi:hypothetical protein